MNYRREIDGLRAVAVVPVILFHAGFGAFRGGYLGVDVFFVVSGYLITGIIAEEMAVGQFSIVRFYERRARRILPALFFIMACCIPFAWMWMDPFELKEFSQSVFATSLFSSNILFYLKTGYFDVSAELKPLLHTWSLAVEEQFYLAFPLVLLLLWRRTGTLALRVLTLVLVASFAVSAWGSRANPSWSFYLPFARVWELMVGALCALSLRRSSRPSSEVLPAFGLLLILGPIVVFNEETVFPLACTLLPVLGTALIILYGSGASWTHRILSSRVLVAIGLVSYSAYLWHQPILAFSRLRSFQNLSSSYLLAASGASLLLAMFSYRFIERPFRTRTARFLGRRSVIFGAAAACIVVFSGLGLWGDLSRGFPERNTFYSRLAQNFGLSNACNGNSVKDKACRSASAVRAVLWGDSYAMHIANPLKIAEAPTGIAQVTLSACPPIVGYQGAARKSLTVSCEQFNDLVYEELRNDHEGIERVYLSSTFSALVGADADKSTALFIKTISAIRAMGLEVIIVGPSPAATFDITKCLKFQARASGNFNDCDFPVEQLSANYIQTTDALKKIASATGVRFIDLKAVVCPDGRCHVFADGHIIYGDSGHFSIESATLLARAFRR